MENGGRPWSDGAAKMKSGSGGCWSHSGAGEKGEKSGENGYCCGYGICCGHSVGTDRCGDD